MQKPTPPYPILDSHAAKLNYPSGNLLLGPPREQLRASRLSSRSLRYYLLLPTEVSTSSFSVITTPWTLLPSAIFTLQLSARTASSVDYLTTFHSEAAPSSPLPINDFNQNSCSKHDNFIISFATTSLVPTRQARQEQLPSTRTTNLR